MDFGFSAEQQKWYDAAVAFAKEQLVDPDGVARDQRGEFWREGYERCARFGAAGLTVPREYGGQGEEIATAVAAMEGLGYACADTGLLFSLNASLWTITMPILMFGDDAQKARFLPPLVDGRHFGANGASEPEAGSDIFSMKTRAERKGDRWVLNGRKVWITGGPVADVFLCFATTDPTKGVLGITAFLIDRDTPGFKVVREIDKLGMRTAPMGELVFENCELPLENMLGREGRGSRIFNQALEWERGAILASIVGTMRRQVDRCVHRARTRKQFGQSIGKFQSVSNRIVDMMTRVETSRYMVYRYAWLKQQGKDATIAASMAKLHVSENFVQNSIDAVRIFGAAGYTIEEGLERDIRDGVGGVLFSGTNDIQRNIIAQHLRI
ncbi:MAG: acyl-CoA dehydrogenase family protein [Paludisphaera borealis]|uniref:acyl-CoA dehydrogenase family protein n=1 Tax=Paludisphaera borealis TaxID=1387353 RepID=UPI0028442182|nr:acyl-CoA dehydrogenase family protein [Paludisphaera borealis]MDR3622400.1 acyl-CoA dehydrogenase family protein [Paludisphaera borealis]